MKIGLITYPLNNNYGNLLQAYALMTVLKRMGHEPWLLDIKHSNQQSVLRKHFSFIKRIIKKYLMKREVFSVIPHKDIRHHELNTIIFEQYSRSFIDKYLYPKISPIYSSEELAYLTENIEFDVFIAGSDQIWRPQLMPYFLKTAYFDFLKDRKVKKIAYAASFGTDEWEYNSKLSKECEELIKKFDAVSVRESTGVSLCKKYFNINAQFILDPTFLLSKENYIHLTKDMQNVHSSANLFCYILDQTDEKHAFIDSVSKELLLEPFYMGLNVDQTIEKRVFDPIEKWLKSFIDAKFVITDSYHGMVFSIIFNIPFLCIVNEKRGLARFKSLSEILGLSECLVFNLSEFSVVNIHSIDWKNVNQILIEKKKDAMTYLLTNLV